MSFDFHDTLNHHNNPTTSPSSTRRGRFGLFSRAKIAKWHFAYGVPLDTKSGGTLLQNLFRESLGDDIKTATYEVTSPSAAIAFLEMMQQLAGDGARRVGEENAEEHSSTSSGTDGSSADGSSTDDSTDDDSNNIINNNNKRGADFGNSDEKFIVVVDGMAALWMGPQILRSLRALSHVSCLCGFVHYPFSATEWYRDEPWLRDLPALPPPPPDATVGGDGTLGVKDAGPPRKITNKNEDADRAARLRAYEAAALGTFNRTIVVGDACRIALTELLRRQLPGAQRAGEPRCFRDVAEQGGVVREVDQGGDEEEEDGAAGHGGHSVCAEEPGHHRPGARAPRRCRCRRRGRRRDECCGTLGGRGGDAHLADHRGRRGPRARLLRVPREARRGSVIDHHCGRCQWCQYQWWR